MIHFLGCDNVTSSGLYSFFLFFFHFDQRLKQYMENSGVRFEWDLKKNRKFTA